MNKDQKDALRLLPYLAGHFNIPARSSTNSSPQNGSIPAGTDYGPTINAVAADFALHKLLDYAEGHGPADIYRSKQRVFHSNKFGIVGGVGIDESSRIRAMLDTVGAGGGGICVISATNSANNVIELAGLASCYWSNMVLDFHSPVVINDAGGIRTMGAMDEFVRAPATFAGGINTGDDAAVGDTIIILSATAGKMQASDFQDGDLITIRGENDASGKALTKQIVTILSRNTGTNTITISEELEYTFLVTYPDSAWHPPGGGTDGTTIYVNRACSFVSNVARGAMTAEVNNIANVAVGNMVRVYDKRVEVDLNAAAIRSGGAGPYKNECHLEYVTITSISGNFVTFERPLSKSYLAGSPNFGGIAKVLPVENVVIQGLDITYSTSQTSRNSHAVSLNFSKDCVMQDCKIDGSGGARAQMFRISDSLNCWGERLLGENPVYHESAEGYICTNYKSSRCGYRHSTARGGRHNFLMQACTVWAVDSCQSWDSWISGIDTHGVDEWDGLVTDCMLSQLNHHPLDAANGGCGRGGNTSHTVGSHWTTWQNCVFFGNPETDIAGLDILAASTHQIVDSCTFYGGYYGIKNSKNPSQCTPTQTISDVVIQNCKFFNITNRPIYLEGVPDTASGTRSSGKMDWVLLEGNVFTNCTQHIRVTGGGAISNLTIGDNWVRHPVASTGQHAIDVSGVVNLEVYENKLAFCNKGISLTTCTGVVEMVGNILTQMIDAVSFTDGGGNSTIFHEYNSGYDTAATAGVFTSDISITEVSPQIAWIETGVTANNTRWDILVDGEVMYYRLVNDANTAATAWMTVNRTANVADSIDMAATALNLTGVTKQIGNLLLAGNFYFDSGSTNVFFEIQLPGGAGAINSGNGRELALTAGTSDNSAGKRGGHVYLRGGVPTSPATTYGDVIINDLGGRLLAMYDQDRVGHIGRAAIGGNGFTDVATFAHLDNNNTTDYSLAQTASGATHLNSKSGQVTSLQINNTDVATVSNTGVSVVGTISAGPTVADGKIHIEESGRGFFVVTGTGIGATAVDISANGRVTNAVVLNGIFMHSAGTFSSWGSIVLVKGAQYDQVNGAGTLRISVTTPGGKMQAKLQAGTGTFDFTLIVSYL